ncbi:hypothetical protein [Streptomyces ficellus]|uniref:hypothetical protein n=1 Tax=Streptomyces ficellus TaxID=1977088 RepID=UPI001FCC49D0|nr:hypothetical protein [Streptomyces ficellus]
MASKTLARGMGTFFKDCEHPQSRWSKCPHLYKVRYRDAAGKQVEESGFAAQDDHQQPRLGRGTRCPGNGRVP